MNINIRQNLKNHAKIWQMIIIINSNEKMRKGVNPREKFLNSNVAMLMMSNYHALKNCFVSPTYYNMYTLFTISYYISIYITFR